MRDTSVPYTDGVEFEIYHGRDSLTLVGMVRPDNRPLRGPGGLQWPVGTKFLFLGGKHTSAGFKTIDVRPPFDPLEYLGQVENLDGHFAVFRTPKLDENTFFAFNIIEDHLHFGTNTLTSRVIELHKCITVENANQDPISAGPAR